MSTTFGGVFQSFISERPVCVMARAVLERMLDADRLDALFENFWIVVFARMTFRQLRIVP